tara:strand:+ start:558 stop:815 length:258 start_codon:yes stop_codon:yes gene_type:complete
MDVKQKRDQLLKAAENAINELIKVMDKKMDLNEVDPEKVKISASAYRLAMEDAMAMMAKVEELSNMNKTDKKEKREFFGVENRAS